MYDADAVLTNQKAMGGPGNAELTSFTIQKAAGLNVSIEMGQVYSHGKQLTLPALESPTSESTNGNESQITGCAQK